ncbi:TPR-like protein [Eremomyces bilateralis CBS 781.70]|uniref:TPR-like protein n=1 Tax=Eremomyces bilateralis CBS 781.70 TaxID=1392243 RepID=A0A6G1G060_9PEZI|nr:TPR-like protein [Eremomyces bilateralis CBS 781.70]KAF1811310.1 TPR-like protein [Eremomyces bilateralis CBS 781.70]
MNANPTRKVPRHIIKSPVPSLMMVSSPPSPHSQIRELRGRALDEMFEGNLNESNNLFLQAIELAEHVLDDDDDDKSAAQLMLATNYREQDRHGEAEPIDRDVLARQQRTLGENDVNTLTTMENLAFDLKVLGWMEIPGVSSNTTMTRLSNLANFYTAQRRYQEAVGLHEKILEWRIQELGREHSLTIASMDLLGIAYRGLGQLDRAVQLQEVAAETAKAQLGEMNPTTIKCILNLAHTYKALDDQGQEGAEQHEGVEKAIRILEEALQVFRNARDEDSLSVAIMNNLAVAYMNIGRLQNAKLQLQSCHAWNEKTLGDDHPNTLLTRENLNLVLEKLGENSD